MHKKIYDPVHGFIRLSSLEKELIDSYPFRRLHSIRQLGVAYLVYPGASHTRFEHSLGVMEIATKIFDKVTLEGCFLHQSKSLAYWRQVVRLAALCHDLGHLPFSHLAEKKLLGVEGHEKWSVALMQSYFFKPIWEKFQKQFPLEAEVKDVCKIALGEKKYALLYGQADAFTPWEKILGQMIAGDFFGADRIDYLLRDARCTGVSYGLFDYQQLIEMLQIFPVGKELYFGVEENGIASCEALLLARHFMHRRVYQHPSVQAYSFHMARFMKKLYEKEQILSSTKAYASCTDDEVLVALRKAFVQNDPDALAIFTKQDRFLAYELPSSLQKSEIASWQKKEGIDSQEIELFFSEEEEVCSLTFPVLRQGLVVKKRGLPSVTVPVLNTNWLYIHKAHKKSAEQLLLQCDS